MNCSDLFCCLFCCKKKKESPPVPPPPASGHLYLGVSDPAETLCKRYDIYNVKQSGKNFEISFNDMGRLASFRAALLSQEIEVEVGDHILKFECKKPHKMSVGSGDIKLVDLVKYFTQHPVEYGSINPLAGCSVNGK